jgi:hypothetical protein
MSAAACSGKSTKQLSIRETRRCCKLLTIKNKDKTCGGSRRSVSRGQWVRKQRRKEKLDESRQSDKRK